MNPAAVCTLAMLTTELRIEPEGLLEQTVLEVEAPCAYVTFDLPPATRLQAAHGKAENNLRDPLLCSGVQQTRAAVPKALLIEIGVPRGE